MMQSTRKKVTTPPTQAQMNCRQATTMITEFLSSVKEFVRVGFMTEIKKKKTYGYHMATAYNWQHAVAGEYPDQYIDYSKVLFSKGKMAVAQTMTATKTETGITFDWELESGEGVRSTDVLMMMAYEPAKKTGYFVIGGAMRSRLTDYLNLRSLRRTVALEVYVAFISASRKIVSNSQYMGQFIWEGKKVQAS